MKTNNRMKQIIVVSIIATVSSWVWAQAESWTTPVSPQAASSSENQGNAAAPSPSGEPGTASTEAPASSQTTTPVSETASVQAASAPVEPATSPAPSLSVEEKKDLKASVDDKKKAAKLQLSSEDGNFSLSPLLLVQPTFVIPIDSEAEHEAAGSGIVLKRARLGFDATLFKIASVKLWGDFRNGAPELVDGYVDVDPLKGKLVVRVGWFRPWFGRQRIASAAKQEFVEFAQAWNDKQLGLNLNRDMGLALNGIAGSLFEWGLGIFNGEKTFALNINRDFGFAARAVFHPLAAAGVSEPLKANDETPLKGDKPALAIGGAFSVESRRDRAITPEDAEEALTYEDVQLKVGGEIAFQWSRLALQGELFFMKTRLGDNTGDDVIAAIDALSPTASVRGAGLGAYFQTGVMVVKNIFELAGRFDWVDEHLDSDGSRFYPTFAANIYIKGHNLKLQTFYRANIEAGYADDAEPTHLIELMLQAAF